MPGFRVSGSTGQAPNTAFFPPIPNQLNMLWPYHDDKTVASNDKAVSDTGLNQANLASQWTLYNTSYESGANALTVGFGGNTTAPDGTNTAVKLVETTTNSIHKIEAAIPVNCWQQSFAVAPSPCFKMRFAFFAKAVERSRVALYVYTASNQPPTNGIKVVFDLAGHQVGVAPAFIPGGAAQGNGWLLDAASITPWPDNWNLCLMDVVCGVSPEIAFSTIQRVLFMGIYLDNGSGTAAESTSYTGTAGSGVYLWRTNAMPPAAWKMSGQRVFFDDFDDPNTVDTNLTYAPGKNFYMQAACFLNINADFTKPHGFNFYPDDINHNDSSVVSVSGSNLTIHTPPGHVFPGPGPNILITVLPSGGSVIQPYNPASTAGAIGTQQSWTGFTYGPPYLYEFSMRYDYDVTDSHGGFAIWSDSAEFHTQPQLTTNLVPGNGACSLGAYSMELDYFELDHTDANTSSGGFNKHMNPGPNNFTGNPNNGGPFLSLVEPGAGASAVYGILTWSPKLRYTVSAGPTDFSPQHAVYYIPDGNVYRCILFIEETSGGPDNPPPPSDPTHWSLAGTPASLKLPVTNLNNYNRMSTLHLPYTKEDGAGWMMQFFNGFHIPFSSKVYAPTGINGGFSTEPAQIMHAYVDNNDKCHLFQIFGGGGGDHNFYSWDWFSYKK